jgi:hypothetical protein
VGPQFYLEYPIRDPRHVPAEMAVALAFEGFRLPPELAAVYPEPPPELLANPDIDPDDPAITY